MRIDRVVDGKQIHGNKHHKASAALPIVEDAIRSGKVTADAYMNVEIEVMSIEQLTQSSAHLKKMREAKASKKAAPLAESVECEEFTEGQ